MWRNRVIAGFVVLVLLLGLVAFPGTQYLVNAASYDRVSAEDYADLWTCNECSPEPHNPDYSYYEGADCTNYASQVLHAGGYPFRGWNKYSIFHWFPDSRTWTYAPDLNQYFSQYQETEFVYRSWPTDLDRGDIFLQDWPPGDGIPDHAAVIVGQGGGLRDQHSGPRKRVAWDYMMPEGTAYWSWQVVW